MPLLAATPPATTKVFFKILFSFKYISKAFLVFSERISSMVFWNEAAKSNLSCLVFISDWILNIAVFNPAKDKLHPPLFNIGLGRLNLFLSPCSAYFSILGPPGN